MGEVIVKLITSEIIKVSTVKEPPAAWNGVITVTNHLGEIFTFSPHTIAWIKFMPSGTGE